MNELVAIPGDTVLYVTHSIRFTARVVDVIQDDFGNYLYKLSRDVNGRTLTVITSVVYPDTDAGKAAADAYRGL